MLARAEIIEFQNNLLLLSVISRAPGPLFPRARRLNSIKPMPGMESESKRKFINDL